MTVERLHQRAAILGGVGALQQCKRRVVSLGSAFLSDAHWDAGRALGDEADTAMGDGVGQIGLAREAGEVARGPDGAARPVDRGKCAGGGGFGLWGTAEEKSMGVLWVWGIAKRTPQGAATAKAVFLDGFVTALSRTGRSGRCCSIRAGVTAMCYTCSVVHGLASAGFSRRARHCRRSSDPLY